MKKKKFLSFIIAFSLGCTSSYKTEQIVKVDKKTFTVSGAEVIPDNWWISFRDTELNTVINDLLNDNISLKMAWSRVDQAVASAKIAGAQLSPGLQASAGASESASAKIKEFSSSLKFDESFALSLSAQYEIDVWSKLRSAHKAAIYNISATEQDLASVAMTLSAETASLWYRLLTQAELVSLKERQVETNRQYLQLVRDRYYNGLTSASDIFQQEQLLVQSQSELDSERTQKKLYEHQMDLLMGKAPGEYKLPIFHLLPELPPFPETGIPADLLKRRPDVKAAFLRIKVADSQKAFAIANRYPSLSFTASLSSNSIGIENLFTNWAGSLAANLVAPILDGGKRSAEVEKQNAILNEKIHAYGNTLLSAVKEVEDAIVRETRQKRSKAQKKKQFELALNLRKSMMERYINGAVDYTLFLDALKNEQKLESDLLISKSNLLLYRIDLYRALAGDFDLQRNEKE